MGNPRIRTVIFACLLILIAGWAWVGSAEDDGTAAPVAAQVSVDSASDGVANVPSPSPSSSPPPPPSASDIRLVPAGYRLPAPVQREVAVAYGGSIYIAGGLDAAGSSAAGVFRLHPRGGSLTRIGTLPRAFHDGAGAVIGHSLFVFGGGTGQSSAIVQAIDLSGGRARLAGRLPMALSDLAAASVRGTIYLVGGWNGITPQPTIWATDDGRTFRRAGALPVGLRYPAVASSGTDLLIAGGVLGNGAETRAVYRFDTTTGRTSRLARLRSPLGHAMAFVWHGRLYVAGGRDASGAAERAMTKIPLAGGAPIRGTPLARPLADAATVPIGGGVMLIGGFSTTTVGQVLRSRVVAVGAATSDPRRADPSTTLRHVSRRRPFAGLLLIADRGNDRLLVVNRHKQIVWRYPSPAHPAPSVPFYFPDDAFWVHGGHAILVNEEENDVLVEIAYPSGRTIWTYGHPRSPGSGPGYLHQPDDAYPYPFGRSSAVVADAKNCRLLFFNHAGHALRQIGITGNCTPGLPRTVGYPNASTPLRNGDLLTSELYGGIIARVHPSGAVVWQRHVPGVGVPSDPQPMPDGSVLSVDYAHPGGIVRFRPYGGVVWSYHPTSGPGVLDHPSLGASLPNGLVAVNDDYNDRMILIDPATNRIVWQYGVTNVPGRRAGHLNIPDGFDLLLPGGVIPLHIDFSSQIHYGRP
jgi:outer membrane protein assembly factor BamB